MHPEASHFHRQAGMDLWCKRTRGRARRGQRAVRIVNGRRGHQLTMTFAVSATHGLIHHDLSDRGMTGDHFRQFLSQVAENLPANEQDHVFLFDNAPSHRSAGSVQLPQNCIVKWLPPYSPVLNIVENCFSQWKANVKRGLAENRDSLLLMEHSERMAVLAQLAEQHASVTPHDAAAFFRHLQSYLPACMTRNDIIM